MTSRTEKSKKDPLWVESVNIGRKGATYFLALENVLTARPAGYFESRCMDSDNQQAIVQDWEGWMTTFRDSKHRVLTNLAQMQHKQAEAVTGYRSTRCLLLGSWR